MAVPAPKRITGRFRTLDMAFEMCAYTLQCTKNEKNFPKHGRLMVKMETIAIDIVTNIDAANEINKVACLDDCVVRRKHQLTARNECHTLLVLLTLAKEVYGIEERRAEYWTGLVSNLKDKIQSWRYSDQRTYSEYAAQVDALDPDASDDTTGS